MVNDPVTTNHPVRALKKVRRHFLNKAPEEPEEAVIISTSNCSPSYFASSNNQSLNHNQNKGSCLEPRMFNYYFNVANVMIENRLSSKMVTINFSLNEHSSILYWENLAKKLEEGGSLDYAVWAHRFRSHMGIYRKAMVDYQALLKSEDPLVQKNIRKVQRQAMLMCKEIESKYTLFHKYTQLMKKEAHVLLSASFTEEFLEQIEHSPESFASLTKQSGMPQMFDTTSPGYLSVIKDFVGFVPMISQPSVEGEEMEVRSYNKEGHPQNMKLKLIGVFEPRADAPLNHIYFISRKSSTNETQGATSEDNKDDNDEAKLKKRIVDVGS